MARGIWITIICLLVGVMMTAAQTPEDDPEMIETALEDNHVQFNFSYPADWVSGELESPFLAIQLATTDDLIESDLLGGADAPVLPAGEVWTAIFLADQRQFPDTGDLANEASVADTADAAAQAFAGLLQEVEVCRTQINDRPAALITGYLGEEEGFDLLALLIDMGVREDRRQFGQILALSGLGEMEEYLPTFLSMAATMEVLDDGEARPLDEVESSAELLECEELVAE